MLCCLRQLAEHACGRATLNRGATASFAALPNALRHFSVLPPRPRRRVIFEEAPAPALKAPLVATHTIRQTLHMAPPGVKFEKADAAAAAAFTHGVPAASTGNSDSRSAAHSATDAAAAAAESTRAFSSPSSLGRMFAVISLGGTQYKVTPGDIINAEHIRGAEVGSTLSVDAVHAVGSVGSSVLGRPVVPGAVVRLIVEEQTLDKKVVVFKKKRRKRYQRTQGHRRMVTRLRVDSISCDLAGGTFQE